MGSYYIPNNNLKGESRILYIFTAKSLIFTVVGAFIGMILYFIFGIILGLKPVGIACVAILSLIGYGIGTIKMPTAGNTKLAKNVGGDSLDDIILRYILFNKNKKVYTYAIPRKEPDYANKMDSLNFGKLLNKITNNTKEEK